ncbi:MAG: hypothetical protein JNM86_09145 [Phycisphaerae bacterium]|nr:hypothetical protein [Phycisphaerae bacterium]
MAQPVLARADSEPVSLVHTQAKLRNRSHLVRATLAGLAACLTGALAGCQSPLLSPDEPRSQYDRYDAVRDQRAATTYTDEFGYKRPNLRGRLLPKE